jgi:hypothetical protein
MTLYGILSACDRFMLKIFFEGVSLSLLTTDDMMSLVILLFCNFKVEINS